jgi:hypothetical protein
LVYDHALNSTRALCGGEIPSAYAAVCDLCERKSFEPKFVAAQATDVPAFAVLLG